jgi:hypothetical protein
VEVEVVDAEVGEAADGEPHAAHPAELQRVARHLHRDRPNPALDRHREQRVQVGGLGGGAHARDRDLTQPGLDGADQAGRDPGRPQPSLQQVYHRRLAGRAGHPEHTEPLARAAVHAGRHLADRLAGVVDDESRYPDRDHRGAGRVGENRHGTGLDGAGDELGTVPAGTGQRRVQVTRPDLAAGERDTGDGDIHVVHGCTQKGREVAQPRGRHASGSRIAGHGDRPYRPTGGSFSMAAVPGHWARH